MAEVPVLVWLLLILLLVIVLVWLLGNRAFMVKFWGVQIIADEPPPENRKRKRRK